MPSIVDAQPLAQPRVLMDDSTNVLRAAGQGQEHEDSVATTDAIFFRVVSFTPSNYKKPQQLDKG